MQSIGNSVDKLNCFLEDHEDCKFLLITEHWKTSEELNSVIVRNFVLVSKMCRDRRKHGGAPIFVRKDVRWKNKSTITKFSRMGEIEIAAAECFVHEQSFVVVSIYRPPSGNVTTFFHQLEAVIQSRQ